MSGLNLGGGLVYVNLLDAAWDLAGAWDLAVCRNIVSPLFTWFGHDGVSFGLVRFALLLVVVLVGVGRCLGWMLLGLFCLLSVTPRPRQGWNNTCMKPTR